MAFRFNFSDPLTNVEINNDEGSLCQVRRCKTNNSVPCKYINLTDASLQPNALNVKKIKFGALEIKYITQKTVVNEIGNSGLIHNTELDLLPGKYEGGLKVWECAFDLTHFLVENNYIQAGDSVLELGCGVGLPGIAAYLCGASVTFQDFNSEVLEFVTAPNVILNTSEEEKCRISEKCKFLCGDWECIMQKFYAIGQEKELFDVVLTSETIYEKCNQTKLLDLMKVALKPGGTIYLASKVHYFGVGGGIVDFEKLVKEDSTLEVSTVFRMTEGVERRILQLMFKKNL